MSEDSGILEGFEIFTEVGKSFRPKISIRKSGQVGFNTGAIERFGLEQYDNVVMLYNKESGKIAFRFVDNDNEPGAMRFMKRKGNYFISARSFMEKYNISYKKSISFDVEWLEDHKIAIINLNDESIYT